MLSAQRVWEKISINFFPLPSVLQCGNTKNRGDITLRKLSLFSSSPESQKHRAAEIFGISKTVEKNLWRQAVTQPLYIPIVSMHKLLCKSVFSHHVVFPLPNIACTAKSLVRDKFVTTTWWFDKNRARNACHIFGIFQSYRGYYLQEMYVLSSIHLLNNVGCHRLYVIEIVTSNESVFLKGFSMNYSFTKD